MTSKKPLYLLIIGLILLSLLFFEHLILSNYAVSLEYPLSSKTIVIDPGHGGIDPGKVGLYGQDEKFINFEISVKLKELLESSGANVVMTREDNEGLYIENVPDRTWRKKEDMRKRKQIITESGGDMMISIHMNSYPDTRVQGAQAFYLVGDEESEKLGNLIQEELAAAAFKPNKRAAKSNDSYFMLKNTGMPSLVVECGFLSNVEEEQKLNDSNYQEEIAWGILKGIARYFYEQ